MTVVFDTNVIVAALLANGLCHKAFRRAGRRMLVSSPGLIDELETTLRRKFRAPASVRVFVETLREEIRLVDPEPLPAPVCRDPDDDLVLATAVAAMADCIVTGDQDLLVLHTYRGVRMLSPREFMEHLDGNRTP